VYINHADPKAICSFCIAQHAIAVASFPSIVRLSTVTSWGNAATSSLRYLSLSRGTSTPSSENLGRQLSSNRLTSFVCGISGEYAFNRRIHKVLVREYLHSGRTQEAREDMSKIMNIPMKYKLLCRFPGPVNKFLLHSLFLEFIRRSFVHFEKDV
jgi:hypothetical protein